MEKSAPSHYGPIRLEIDLSRDQQIPANSLVNDYLVFKTPEHVFWYDGRPYRLGPEKAPSSPQIETADQAINRTANTFIDAMRDKPGSSAADAINAVTGMLFVKFDVDPNLKRKDLPYNADQVIPGAYALLTLPQGTEQARSIRIDRATLAQHLARYKALSPMRQALGRAFLIIDAAETDVLDAIATQLDQALETSMSVIMSSAELQRDLAAALDIRGKPALVGQATKSANQALAASIRQKDAEAQAAQAGSQPTPPAPQGQPPVPPPPPQRK